MLCVQIVVSVYAREVRTIEAFAWSDQARAYVERTIEKK